MIYISKVFTDTEFPHWIKETDKIKLGGTGFFFENSPNLPEEIEHHKPDYNLYNKWIKMELDKARIKSENNNEIFDENKFLKQFKNYTDYSIGFLTRGCFRKCKFCVNQKYNNVFKHSEIEEFYDENRKGIIFLDDNFFGYKNWKEELEKIKKLKKKFVFKQGLDERLLDDEKCKLLFSSKYDGHFIFAFDSIKDYDLVEKKLKLIRKYTKSKNIKFYILVGYESIEIDDIVNAWERIKLLMKYGCFPYIMRYQNKNNKPYLESKYKDMYNNLASWCNQPKFFNKLSFREYCQALQKRHKNHNSYCSAMKILYDFDKYHKEISEKYFDLKIENEYK